MGEIANVTNHIMFPIDEVVATLIIEYTSMTGPIPARSIALIAIWNPHFAELVAARATPLLTPAAALNEPRMVYLVACFHLAISSYDRSIEPYPLPYVDALYLAMTDGSIPPASIIPSGLRSVRVARSVVAAQLYPHTANSNTAYTCVMLHSAYARVMDAPPPLPPREPDPPPPPRATASARFLALASSSSSSIATSALDVAFPPAANTDIGASADIVRDRFSRRRPIARVANCRVESREMDVTNGFRFDSGARRDGETRRGDGVGGGASVSFVDVCTRLRGDGLRVVVVVVVVVVARGRVVGGDD